MLMTEIKKNKSIALLLLFSFSTLAQAFENNGVKDGNIKLSMGFFSEYNIIPQEKQAILLL